MFLSHQGLITTINGMQLSVKNIHPATGEKKAHCLIFKATLLTNSGADILDEESLAPHSYLQQ